MKNIYYYETKIGKLGIAQHNGYITNIFFNEPKNKEKYILKETAIIKKAHKQIEEYLDGTRKKFDLPLALEGTEFMKSVWRELASIPYGETRSYKYIAEKIDNPKAVRAVGMANNKNPIGIIIPCHRVIGINGKLVGYAGGLNKKEYLLKLEAENAR